MVIIGALFYNDAHVASEWCLQAAQSHRRMFSLLLDRGMPTQIGMYLLRLCMVPRLSYLIRVMPYEVMMDATLTFDQQVIETACRLGNIEEDEITEKIKEQLQLPVARGGFGLLSTSQLSLPAHFCSLLHVLRDLHSHFPSSPLDSSSSSLVRFLNQMCGTLKKIVNESDWRKIEDAISYHQANANENELEMNWNGCITNGPPPQLQHLLTTCLMNTAVHDLFKQSLARFTLSDRIRLAGCALPRASCWLTVAPTRVEYMMSSPVFTQAMRHRLGLLPYRRLQSTNCACDARVSFDSDPSHFHSCALIRSRATTRRHNLIMSVLARCNRSLGRTVEWEPKDHQRPYAQFDNRHADLLVHEHGQSAYIDVSIVHSTAPSNITAAAMHEPLYAVAKRQQAKTKKYAEIAQVNQYRMIPFIMETYGGFGNHAVDYMRRMEKAANEFDPDSNDTAYFSFSDHLYNSLSVALQCGNAYVSMEGETTITKYKRSKLRNHIRNAAAYTSTNSAAANQQELQTIAAVLQFDHSSLVHGSSLSSLPSSLPLTQTAEYDLHVSILHDIASEVRMNNGAGHLEMMSDLMPNHARESVPVCG